jgi:hypothetical protein
MTSKFFRDMFTGIDNKTYDIGRVLWFETVNAYIFLTVYAIYTGKDIDFVTWGGGLAALLGAGGAAIGLKGSTEPRRPDEARREPESDNERS